VEEQQEKIEQAVVPVVRDLDYIYVGCEFRPHKQHALLRFYIDHPNGGILLDDCQRVSERIAEVLESKDLIATSYALEVSSPGVNRLLFTLDHFAQFVGERVCIRLASEGGLMTCTLEGVIEGILEGNRIVLRVDGKRKTIPVTSIKKANLIRNLVIEEEDE
jgi:ribosome maturation factor RimP